MNVIAMNHPAHALPSSRQVSEISRRRRARPFISHRYLLRSSGLLWRDVCQAGNAGCPRRGRASCRSGGGGLAWCATRGQTLIRGSTAAGPGFVVRAGCLRSSVAARAAHVRSLMLSRVCQVPPLLDRRGVERAGVSRRGRAPSRTRRARGRRRPRRSCGACRAPRRGGARRGAGVVVPARRSRSMLAGWPSWRRWRVMPRAGVLR